MKKISIVPELMNSEEICIVDENDIPVTICNRSMAKFNNNFQPPSILIDNFEKRKYKDIEVRNIDVDYLIKLGFRLVSVKCESKTRNFANQKKSYILESVNNPVPNSIVLAKVPPEHYIELDLTNNRVRIKGRCAFPYFRQMNASPWVQAVKK